MVLPVTTVWKASVDESGQRSIAPRGTRRTRRARESASDLSYDRKTPCVTKRRMPESGARDAIARSRVAKGGTGHAKCTYESSRRSAWSRVGASVRAVRPKVRAAGYVQTRNSRKAHEAPMKSRKEFGAMTLAPNPSLCVGTKKPEFDPRTRAGPFTERRVARALSARYGPPPVTAHPRAWSNPA